MRRSSMLFGFGKWLAWNSLVVLIVWVLTPQWNPVFLKVLISNFCGTTSGCNYYSFMFFPWFLFAGFTFIGFVIWPHVNKGSFLK